MDALALLCTLHADGPSTLKNLRQAGCGSLEAIESMEEERLSQVLGAPAAVARRFVREARHLRERLEPGMLDREEAQVDPANDTVVHAGVAGQEAPTEVFDLAARLALSNLAPISEARDRSAPPDSGAALDRAASAATSGLVGNHPRAAPTGASRDPMADVLEAWRTRDEVEAPEPTVPAPVDAIEPLEDDVPPRPVRARPEFEFGAEIVAAMRELTSTIAPGGSQITSTIAPGGSQLTLSTAASLPTRPKDEPLVEGLSAIVEGQGAELALRLGEEGLRDLRDLTDADVLALSERLGFGYTRILRLVQIARRVATGSSAASTPAFGAGVRPMDVVVGTADAVVESVDRAVGAPDPLAGTRATPKISPDDRPRSQRPSILELEWNLEIQPQAPPRERGLPDSTIPEASREGAGGPFA